MNTGLFFDLDGTLWDSAETVVKSWNEVFAKKNLDLRISVQDMRNVMGKLMTEIADILFTVVPKEERINLLHECEVYENELIRKEGGNLFKNVEETLKILSEKYKLFIISNCQEDYIESFLEYYDLGKYITDTENPGVTGLPKADNIKLVAERNNIDNIIYIGDTNGDYLSTKAAGGLFIHAAYGFGSVEENTLKIYDLSELPALIEKQEI